MPCHPIHLPWRASLSVAWLHVYGVCVSVPGQERCQYWAHHSSRREIGGLGTRTHRTLASSLGTHLAQSVVLETGPQPSPSTATFPPTPASFQRTAHHRSCQPGRTCANCGVGRLGLDPQPLWPPSPHPEQMSSSGCGPYLTPFLPVLQPAHLSLPAHHWHVSCLLWFCSLVSPSLQLLICVGVEALAPSSSRCLLTLSMVSKLQEQDGNFLLPCPIFQMGPGRLRPSWPPLLLIVPPSLPPPAQGRVGVCPGPSTSQQELRPASCCPLERDKGAAGWLCPRLWAAALHAGTQLLPSAPPSL